MAFGTLIITQARVGSSRLPAKILKEINGSSILDIHLNRLKKCNSANAILVATTTNTEDNIVIEIANKNQVLSFRGSENDVLDRYYQAAKFYNPTWIVRVTSDCPLVDPELIDKIILYVQSRDVDYGSNTLVEKFPDGQDIEVFKFSALKYAWQNAKKLSEREHVTLFIKSNSSFYDNKLFKSINYECPDDYSKIRMTLDEDQDLTLITKLITGLGINANWQDYTRFIIENNLLSINGNIIRNEGLLKSLKND